MKARIRKTGEIVDVIAYSQYVNRNCDTDYVSYIDSKGIEHDVERGLNFYWDFEPVEGDVENKPIDWEQRRYEIAKVVLQGIWSDNKIRGNGYDMTQYEWYSSLAKKAIMQADALINELKNKKQ